MDDGILFKNTEGYLLDELLDEDYPEILEAIKKEGYNLDFKDFDVFYGIPFENQIVGFISFGRFSIAENQLGINDAYIIPKYRGNNLFFDKLFDFFLWDNFEFYPRKPTKAFIKVLLKNDYAFELAPNFVLSYFKFILDVESEVYINPKIKRFYKEPCGIPYAVNLFDMDLCSVMFKDDKLDLIRYTNFFALSEPRKYDLKKYNCRKKLKRVSERYLDKKFKIWEGKSDEIMEFIQRKDIDFANRLSIDNTIGSEDKLVDEFIQRLEDNNLSISDGFKIRANLVNKLESGEVNEKSYMQRALYLLNHFEDIDKEIDEFDADELDVCPFCGDNIQFFAKSCSNCGLHIMDFGFEERTADILNKTIEKLQDEDIDIDLDKVLGIIPIEDGDDDELRKFKEFYNKNMLSYDFDEVLSFYNSCDKNISLEKIMDLFLDNKLNKSAGTKKEFKTYFDYLIHYFYYNKENGNYDGAFVNLIRLAVLYSNKYDNKKKILFSNPIPTDVDYAVEVMLELNYSFDVSKLFDEAINNFKISKYNKNHKGILREFKEIFG